MKMLLVAAGDEYDSVLGYHLKPLGFTVERESDPVQVIERLDSIDPQAILFDGNAFPRHWKPLLSLARQSRSREELIFLLVAPPDLDPEEAAKAAHLGVNGILGQDLSDKQELYRLEEIVRRYQSMSDKRSFARIVPSEPDELGFAFTHPRRMSLVMGKIREISIQGSSFLPNRFSAVSDLAVGTEIPNCSLKIDERIVSVSCKLTRNREEIGLQFLSFGEDGHHELLRYIQSRSQRALKSAAAQKN